MSERKRRVRTGCLTCRRRHVKCDERKPLCQRCQAANLVCNGYESKRYVAPKPRPKFSSSGQDSQKAPTTIPDLASEYPSLLLPLVALPNNPRESQRPHSRARDVLAHHQYNFRTVSMLFREDHLYFWRDHILEAAWEIEYVWDAVISIGTIHRSVLLLAQPHDQWRGYDVKVVGLAYYGNALRRVSGEVGAQNDIPRELLIAVLLLLTYFECFVNNPAAAFRHLLAAKHYFISSEAYLSEHKPSVIEPLKACMRQLELVTQIILPSPECIASMPRGFDFIDSEFKSTTVSAAQEKQQIINIIYDHPSVNRAIWTPLSQAVDQLDPASITEFQDKLSHWRENASYTFQEYDDLPQDLDWNTLDDTVIPPVPLRFVSPDAALACALYNFYMSQTMWILSAAIGGDESYEIAAYGYTYQNLRIIESAWDEDKERTIWERFYLPCQAINIGFTPLLYLGANCCYQPTWQAYITEKLHSIGSEGLYDGEAFASCLDLLTLFQNRKERSSSRKSNPAESSSRSPLGHLETRIIPVLYPDTEGKMFIAYFIKSGPLGGDSGFRSIRIVGRAKWRRENEENSKDLSVEFYDQNSAINIDLGDTDVYKHIISREPIIQEWRTLNAQNF